jgi:ankyrin repeat protein
MKHTPLYDLDGDDPLTLETRHGKADVLRKLLEVKVSPNSETAEGYSALLAAIDWHRETVTILLKAGADPNNSAHYWEYPLTAAIESGDQDAVAEFLKSQAQINARDQIDGRTALHAAVLYRNYKGIETLLEAGADPRIKDLGESTCQLPWRAASEEPRTGNSA